MKSELYRKTAITTGLFFLAMCCTPGRAIAQDPAPSAPLPRTYLGLDVNDYPGDDALPVLRRTFAFAGYWLNLPPGATVNHWAGKRRAFVQSGFGFLVLFNGRLDRELKAANNPAAVGVADAQSAVLASQREGFPPRTVIFLDQEEGGRLLGEQMAYVLAWVDGINASEFRPGIYCSGMPAKEGKTTIVTANDIHEHQASRKINYFVYNDACPPSPGCTYPKPPPSPAASGVSFATIWQFAQSPSRHEFTKSCRASYNPDGNCYPPASAATGGHTRMYLDLDSATSADPSRGR